MSARAARLAKILAKPAEMDLRYSDSDFRLLMGTSEAERDRLRAVARDGEPEARVAATLALARLNAAGARELLATALAGDACTDLFADGIGLLREAYPGYRDLVAPWAVRLLESIELPLRESISPALRGLASACGELRIAEAGPVLLKIAEAAEDPAYRAEWPLDCVLFLAAAARAWPGQEVTEVIEGRVGPNPDPARLDSYTVEAIAAIAARGGPGTHEWALQWCAEKLLETDHESTTSQTLVDALTARGQDSALMLEWIVCESPHRAGAGTALRALARIAPAEAHRYAVEEWLRFPAAAIEVLGELYRGTANPEAAALVTTIAKRYQWAAPERDEALARIGATAGSRSIADEMVGLGLVSREAADGCLDGLADDLPPARLVTELFEAEGILVEFDPKSYTVPPAYDDLVEDFAAAAGTSVENLELTEDFQLSFIHNGQSHEFEPDDQGKYFDLLTVDEIAGAMSPAGDPRQFVLFGEETYVLAEPDKLAQLAKTFGLDV